MTFGRFIGWVLILGGIALLARDVIGWVDNGVWAPLLLGDIWVTLDRSSFNFTEDLVARKFGPFLWDPVITGVLLCWASAVLVGLGLLLQLLCQPRPRRRP